MGCIEVEKSKEINCLFIGSKHQGNKHKELEILLVERRSVLTYCAESR